MAGTARDLKVAEIKGKYIEEGDIKHPVEGTSSSGCWAPQPAVMWPLRTAHTRDKHVFIVYLSQRQNDDDGSRPWTIILMAEIGEWHALPDLQRSNTGRPLAGNGRGLWRIVSTH